MQKDVASKLLESENDVFADIFNNLYFGNGELLSNNLTDEPTESFYTDADGNVRNMFRDVFKKYTDGQGLFWFLWDYTMKPNSINK